MGRLDFMLLPGLMLMSLPALGRPSRTDFSRVASFRTGAPGAVLHRLQAFSGGTILYTYRTGIPMLENPASLSIQPLDFVKCSLISMADGKRRSYLRARWRDLKAFLLRPCDEAGKGESIFAGTVVVNTAQHRRRELRMAGAGDLEVEAQGIPLTETGARIPLGPVLILGKLDDSLESSSNRLEPYLVVTRWVALTP